MNPLLTTYKWCCFEHRVCDRDCFESSDYLMINGKYAHSVSLGSLFVLPKWSVWRKRRRHYVTVSLFFLLLLSLQPVRSSPTSFERDSSSSVDMSQLRPKWINPCGYKKFTHGPKFLPNFPQIDPLTEEKMLNNIVNTAYQALQHSLRFQSDYVKITFSVDNWKDHHALWRDQKLGWLPSWEEIPKHLNEKTTLKHLLELEVTSALKNMYVYLQKIAVGLEQIVIDKLVNGGDNEEFIHKFNEAEYKLKAVLCEIQGALIEKDSYEDIKEFQITRQVMPAQWRDISSSHNRNLRDWLIYRDYMNGLEYIIDSLDHLLKNGTPT